MEGEGGEDLKRPSWQSQQRVCRSLQLYLLLKPFSARESKAPVQSIPAHLFSLLQSLLSFDSKLS